MLYKSLALSKINYGIELYGRRNNSWLTQLQKTQNRLMKILFLRNKFERTNKLHTDNHILKIRDQANLRLALLVYDNRHLIETNRGQRYILRNNLNFAVSTNNYNYINKVIEEAILIWNALPNNFKRTIPRDKFKTSITEKALATYTE